MERQVTFLTTSLVITNQLDGLFVFFYFNKRILVLNLIFETVSMTFTQDKLWERQMVLKHQLRKYKQSFLVNRASFSFYDNQKLLYAIVFSEKKIVFRKILSTFKRIRFLLIRLDTLEKLGRILTSLLISFFSCLRLTLT